LDQTQFEQWIRSIESVGQLSTEEADDLIAQRQRFDELRPSIADGSDAQTYAAVVAGEGPIYRVELESMLQELDSKYPGRMVYFESTDPTRPF
jgi:hypothetical protein